MEHNTDRILWTVLVLAIGVALYVSFRPAANDLLSQTTEKIQTIVGGVNNNTSDSSSNKSSNSTTVGTNLFQMSNTTAGYVDGITGGIDAADSTVERVTDFIEVEPNQTYWMQDKVNLVSGQYPWVGVGIYDGDKTFIRRDVFQGGYATDNVTVSNKLKIVMPNNAKYVRVSSSTYGNSIDKFEKGSVATS